jgi:hypothetical protein
MADEPDAKADGPGGDEDVKQGGAHGAPFSLPDGKVARKGAGWEGGRVSELGQGVKGLALFMKVG